MVPGMHWLSVMVCGMKGLAQVASMQWWTTRGEASTQKRDIEHATLKEVVSHWGQRVIHVFDRGYAGAPWLDVLFEHGVRFVMRWPMRFKLSTANGETRQASQIANRKRCVDYRMLRDTRRRQPIKVGVVFLTVCDQDKSRPLTLVVARSKGRKPWYLLTNEPVRSVEEAWSIVLIYARRWQIEIVQSQMTKADMLAAGGGGDDITDLHDIVRHHYPIDQQLDQLPFLLKRGIGQAHLDPPAELLDGGNPSRQFGLLVHLRLQEVRLAGQRMAFLL
jgi:hypothetical protein